MGGLALLVLVGVLSAAERPPAQLATFYEERAREVRHLAAEEELELLAGLSRTHDQERFFREFWTARGLSSRDRMRANRRDTARLALRARGQADVVLLAGKPSVIHRFDSCKSTVRRIEVWEYEGWRVDRQRRLSETETATPEATAAKAGETVLLAFVQRTNLDPRSFELWDREADSNRLVFGEGRGVAPSDLVKEAITLGCVNGDKAALLRRGLEESVRVDGLVDVFGWPQPEPWWLASEPLGRPAPQALATLSIEPEGRFFRQTLMAGRVEVPIRALRTLNGTELFDRVEILGDVYAGDRLVDPFRVVHHLAGAAPSNSIQLDFYRRLLPGQYRLELRVENGAGRSLLRHTGKLTVPKLEEQATQPAGRSRDINQLTRDDVVFLTTSPSVELISPENFPVSGPVTVSAVVRGETVKSVEFVPEQGALQADSAPPFLADIEMSGSRLLLRARALDAEGHLLTEDVITLRRDARPFRVWFDDDSVVDGYGRDQHRVQVQVPEEEQLAWVACFQNGNEVASFDSDENLAQDPALENPIADARFLCPKQAPRADTARLRFDRVVARLVSGEEVEDVLILSQQPDALDVRLVELFVSVLDAQGRPMSGLSAEQFTVLEDGQAQQIERVNAVERLPLSVSVMMDTSSSMGRRVRLAVESTQKFFQDLMREGDVASLFAFQHDLESLVDFTGDRRELDYAAQGLRGSGGTRLFDGLIYNLHSFVGLPARRAMVVLSDGADTESDAAAEAALEAARRSGVLVFPVALGNVGEATEQELQALAHETGGTFFKVEGVAGLDTVYRDIVQILRSQYQVVYRPVGDRIGRGYQQVEIKLSQPGLSVRNVRGYYR